jgi:hypothetical protein
MWWFQTVILATWSMCRGRNKWSRSFWSTTPECIISNGRCKFIVNSNISIDHKPSPDNTTGSPKSSAKPLRTRLSSIRPHSTQQPVPLPPFIRTNKQWFLFKICRFQTHTLIPSYPFDWNPLELENSDLGHLYILWFIFLIRKQSGRGGGSGDFKTTKMKHSRTRHDLRGKEGSESSEKEANTGK